MPRNDEAIDFKRRARRRLVGAIALVLFLVIVPPWVMEREPRPTVSSLSVEIPSQSAKKLATKPAPAAVPRTDDKAAKPPVATPPEKGKPEETAGTTAPQAPSEPPAEKPKPDDKAQEVVDPAAKALKDSAPKKAADKAPETPAESERAVAALAGGYSVTVGTFASPENVKQLQAKLSAAGLKTYTEPVTISGAQQTRVRAGPFPTREAAEKTREKLAGMGLKPGAVAPRQ